ncbi:MAG: hypothetical protein KF870_06910 [Leadbetterella sp.]|nr:hypothetical protein [Leadbetterella sp.]
MLTFFRIYSVFQTLSILIIIMAIRMLFFSPQLPLLSTELEWMLIGRKLNEDLFLYNEVLTQVAPLSSYFYQLIDATFGHSQMVYQVIAAGVVYLQALLLNFMINKRNLFNEKNYIGALLYVVLMSISFDLMKLSPSLLANTFVLLGVNSVLSQIEKRDGVGDDVFETGIFFGLATLFHHPAFVFILWAILTLFLYTGINIRQAFMVILAFLLPLFFMFIFFYFNDMGADFTQVWLLNLNSFVKVTLLNIRDILIVYTLPVVLSLLGVAKVLRGHRYNSFQNRSHQALLILGIFALLAFLLSGKYLPSNLVYFIIPLAFYCAGFFVHSKKLFVPEVVFLLFFSTLIFISYLGAKNIFGVSARLLADYRVSETVPDYNGKRIFITGRNIDAYRSNDMATGYLSWNLARRDFENPDNYLSISNIYNNFTKDMPQVIIDEEGVMPQVFAHIPGLARKYKKTGKNTYELK